MLLLKIFPSQDMKRQRRIIIYEKLRNKVLGRESRINNFDILMFYNKNSCKCVSIIKRLGLSIGFNA
jgi:hypothetical protein